MIARLALAFLALLALGSAAHAQPCPVPWIFTNTSGGTFQPNANQINANYAALEKCLLPATTTSLGIVQPDGITITVNGQGVLSAGLTGGPEIDARQFGVSPGATAAVNSTQLAAAATQAYNLGLPLNLCIGGSNPVTIPTNGAPIFGGVVNWCPGTTYSMQVVGPAFFTLPSPSVTCPGPQSPASNLLTFNGTPVIDMNGHDGTGLLIEGPNGATINNPLVLHTGTGSWTHNDCVENDSYPDAAMTVKGVLGVSGTAPAVINNPTLQQPIFARGGVGATGGVGIWVGTTGAHNTSKPNTLTINGGAISGYTTGIYAYAVGDMVVSGTDLSGNQVGLECGPTGGTCPRPKLNAVYLENDAIGVHFDVTSTFGVLSNPDSISNTAAPCVSENPTDQCNGVVLTSINDPQTFSATGSSHVLKAGGQFDIIGSGGGGGGGGAIGSTGTTTGSAGAGGGAGAYAEAVCDDLLGINFGYFTTTIGAGGPGGVGAGAGFDGGATVFQGLSLTTDWQASTSYQSPPSGPAYILPTVGNAGGFLFAQIVSGTGVSGSVEPTWPQTLGAVVTDNTAIWENIGLTTWNAGQVAVVDTRQVNRQTGVPVMSLVIDSHGNVQRAILAGTTGGSMPSWNRTVLGLTIDGSVWWQNAGPIESMTLTGGVGGNQGATPSTGNISGVRASVNPGSSVVGCTVLAGPTIGTAAGSGFITGGIGSGGYSGVNPLGHGTLPFTWQTGFSAQDPGTNGILYGTGGTGALSAGSASGTDQTGGAGASGFLSVRVIAAGAPW